MKKTYTQSAEEVLQDLGVGAEGLTTALALGMEEAEPDTMSRPPRDSKEGIFAGGLFVDIAYQGILVTAITIISYILGHCFEVGCFEMPKGISPDGMTMAFLVIPIVETVKFFQRTLAKH